jgi:hypothetical protein
MSRTFSRHGLAAIALGVAMVCAAAAGAAAPAAAAAGQRPAASLAATHADEFQGISCTTAKGCLAVGTQFDSKNDHLLALGETRSPGSSTWAVHDPAPVSGATTTGFGPIGNGDTVSCVSSPSAMCMGIGSYNNSAGHQLNYAASWDWSSWKIVNPPNPSPTISSGLDAISCLSSKFCLITGHWFDTSTDKDALESQVWNGKSWKMTKMPRIPANASSGPRLWGLSCVSTTWCMAVGDYDTSEAATQPLMSEIWNGKSWKMVLPPNPSGASAHALVGVSCISTKFCNAVGDSLTSKLALLSLGETWNGKAWTVQPTPKSKVKGISELFDVSCLSAKFCLSTGDLAATWNGKSWSGIAFPVPPGKTTITNAVSLSCLSTKDCTAAGGYSTAAGTFTLAWNWNGKSLSLQKSQNP